jgi:hypothetical protein
VCLALVRSLPPAHTLAPTHTHRRHRALDTLPTHTHRYGPLYVWGQLSAWYKQTVYDPTASLSADRRGTVSLPDIDACYGPRFDAKVRVCE